MEEEIQKPKSEQLLGMPLAAMSVEALHQYIRDLHTEIARVESEIGARGEHRAAAEALFS